MTSRSLRRRILSGSALLLTLLVAAPLPSAVHAGVTVADDSGDDGEDGRCYLPGDPGGDSQDDWDNGTGNDGEENGKGKGNDQSADKDNGKGNDRPEVPCPDEPDEPNCSDDGSCPQPSAPTPQTVEWTRDDDSYWDIESPVRLPKAESNGGGQISYRVVDPGTAICSLSGKFNRRLSFEQPGTCVVEAVAAGNGLWTQGSVQRTITIREAVVPAKVNNLRIEETDPVAGDVVLRWAAPSDTGTHPLVRYRIRVRERNEEDYTVVGYSSPDVRTFTVTGLEPGVYYLRVRAANEAGAGPGFVVGPVTITG